MDRNETIGINEIIARTKLQLNLTNTTQYDDYFTLMISEGIRHLDCLSILTKKVCKVEIQDNKAQLPCGFVRLLAARTVDSDNVWGTMTYSDLKFLNQTGCSTDNITSFMDSFQINNGYIVFNNNTEAATVILGYMGFNVDDDGNIVIYADYERALSSYACYQFALSFFESYPENIRAEYKRTWIAQKNWIKGNDAKIDFQNTKLDIQVLVNAMCINPIDIILSP